MLPQLPEFGVKVGKIAVCDTGTSRVFRCFKVSEVQKVSWKLCEFVAEDIILVPLFECQFQQPIKGHPWYPQCGSQKRGISKDTLSLQQTWILNCHVLSLQEQYIISLCVGFSWGPSAPNCSPIVSFWSIKAIRFHRLCYVPSCFPRLLEHLGPPEQQETGSLEMTQRQPCGFPFLCGQNPSKKCGTWPCEK